MSYLFVINDGHGNERAHSALRLATSLQRKLKGIDLTVFMIGDGVDNAVIGHNTPNGYLETILIKKGKVKL